MFDTTPGAGELLFLDFELFRLENLLVMLPSWDLCLAIFLGSCDSDT